MIELKSLLTQKNSKYEALQSATTKQKLTKNIVDDLESSLEISVKRNDTFFGDADDQKLQRPITTTYYDAPVKLPEIVTEEKIAPSENLSKPNSEGFSIPTWAAYVLLNSIAVIWGTQHAVIKSVVDSGADPALVNFSRFAIATAILTPWIPGLDMIVAPPEKKEPFGRTEEDSSLPSSDTLRSKPSFSDKQGTIKEQWIAGLELGLWMFLGYGFQAIGLQYTAASRSAFLLYLNVKFVPFFAWILLGRHIPAETWISAFIAFGGTALLCTGDNVPLNIGDAWSLAAAAASAMFILRLEKYANTCSPLQLNSANLLIVTFLCGIWTSLEPSGGFRDIQSLFANVSTLLPLLYLGLVTTAFTNLAQTIGQKKVPAEKAAIIYAADPVYGAFFAWLLLGETLSLQGWIGAILILGAAVYSNVTAKNVQDTQGEAEIKLDSDK
mmetsp:Transcript_17858/g.23529  ORF Transcript_17858/g.23529 Transcript_17858/m.23529 type:complete len:440 (-) Transcript_17858:288-1607(-)|eukprot:CAMPEP_0117745486 /NCGR_PEP_ID=MMETSP0947-20121206/7384_1 /TAXON_ID=44440 /ORGANISM="Chattonella subsalsa, Strain CCMP2191" /LENGTH=439 /DNA_ID=CAMNT_0005562637 /DNA_START=248 /DNA_END=1567 /DNA_ORIENTATION=+